MASLFRIAFDESRNTLNLPEWNRLVDNEDVLKELKMALSGTPISPEEEKELEAYHRLCLEPIGG